jgi:putative endonuclease
MKKEKEEKKYFIYILKCADDTLYTGITTDIERRQSEHNSPDKGAKYTKCRQPVSVVFHKEVKNKSEALKEEYRIKQLSRSEKKDFIKENSGE